jgi:hypothetical protein
MKTDSVYSILKIYFEQRSQNNPDSTSITDHLRHIGKSNDEIHEILIEFDDEWDRELLLRKELKNAKIYFTGGLSAAIAIGAFTIFSALNPISLRITYVWHGGIAGGLLLSIKG